MGGGVVIGRKMAHHEHQPAFGLQAGLVDAKGAHHLGAGALDELEVVGVIDDPREIGILVINAQAKAVGHWVSDFIRPLNPATVSRDKPQPARICNHIKARAPQPQFEGAAASGIQNRCMSSETSGIRVSAE